MGDAGKSGGATGGKKASKAHTIVLLPVKVLRVRCAGACHDAASSPPPPPPAADKGGGKGGGKGKGKAAIAPKRPAPADPWLRGLFVLWAVAPPDGSKDPPVFLLGQTDEEGHLSPTSGTEVPDTFKIAGHDKQKYLFYFVRHPDAAGANAVLSAVNGPDGPAKDAYGKPYEAVFTTGASPTPDALTLTTQSGTDAKKQPIEEPVLFVPEKPDFFFPKGSKLYDQWHLYKRAAADAKGNPIEVAMPHAQCEAVDKQVQRLQFHLGALRYLVGDHDHPYTPIAAGEPDKGAGFVNLGHYEVMTWSSVLRFQRDAAAGAAWQVKGAPHGKLLSMGGSPPSEPSSSDCASKVGATDHDTNGPISAEYVDAAADPSAPSFDLDATGNVDKATGDAVSAWLYARYRKPGPILVGLPPPPKTSSWWMWARADGKKQLDMWVQAVQDLGFKPGILLNHTFRDARVDALGAGFGRAKRSIHKTGLAVDLRMHAFVNKASEFPVEFVMESESFQQEQASSRPRVHWRLYAPSSLATIPDGYVDYFASSIQPWVYAPDDPLGGHPEPAPKPGLWLDLTRVGEDFGWHRIHSFGSGDDIGGEDWRGGPRVIGVDDVKALAGVLSEVTQVQADGKLGDAVVWVSKVELTKDFKKLAAPDKAQELTDAGAKKIPVSTFVADEVAVALAWITHFGAKRVGPDLSIDVTYYQKALDEKDETKKKTQLENQLAALLAPTQKPPKKGKNPLIGCSCECVWGTEDATQGKSSGGTSQVTLDALEVGDGADHFPLQSFRLRPLVKSITDNLHLHDTVFFPQTVGEPIGMEWWHFQLTELFDDPDATAKARAAAAEARQAAQEKIKAINDRLATIDAGLKDRTLSSAQHQSLQSDKRDANKDLAEAKKEQHQAAAGEKVSLGRSWFSFLTDIGWTEEGLRALGYNDKDNDFTADAR